MRALGIDPGTKRIGLALSDRSGTIASPFTVLARDRNVDADAAANGNADPHLHAATGGSTGGAAGTADA